MPRNPESYLLLGEIPAAGGFTSYWSRTRHHFKNKGLGSGGWQGTIYVNCENGYPCLITGGA